MEDKYVSVGGYYMYYEDNAYYGAQHLQYNLEADEVTPMIEEAKRSGDLHFEDQSGRNFSLIYDQANYKFRIVSRDPTS